MVLGILVAIAIGLFVLGRSIGGRLQGETIAAEPLLLDKVRSNIEPVARLAVAGQDNSGLAMPAAQAAPAADLPANGGAAYEKACAVCHAAGVAGAPKVGDQAAWGPRIAQGKSTLYTHAIVGFQGSNGVMPARGGTTWPDELIKAAVDHMVALK